jgi:hypothetical protein
MKVFTYFNIRSRQWSIKALEGPDKGRVIDHLALVYLTDVAFKVSESGRQRVLRENRKNVHAGAVGVWNTDNTTAPPPGCPLLLRQVGYNPYKGPTFVDKATGEPVHAASYAMMYQGKVYIQ